MVSSQNHNKFRKKVSILAKRVKKQITDPVHLDATRSAWQSFLTCARFENAKGTIRFLAPRSHRESLVPPPVAFGLGFRYVLFQIHSKRSFRFMLANILFLLLAAYSIMMITLGIAAFRARYPVDRSFAPRVAIIIAARNEEKNIRQCLDSIAGLSYPTDLLEVVIVDDRSTDHTAQIAGEYTAKHSHMKLVAAVPGTGNLRGKSNAVAQGIRESAGDIIMFTDADCSVPPRWVEETVKYYTDASIGIVAGFTALRARRWFDALQALDWFVLFSVAAATIRLRYPVTAVGNNLSVRRAAYDLVGGYTAIPFSVTEDYALFHAVTHGTGYHARFPLDAAALVESDPCANFGELYQQKMRWFTGGKGMNAGSLMLLMVPYGLNVVLAISLLWSPTLAVFCALLIKTSVDLFLTLPSVVAFKRLSLLRYFPVFEVYYILYVLVFPVLVLAGLETTWKERTYGAHR